MHLFSGGCERLDFITLQGYDMWSDTLHNTPLTQRVELYAPQESNYRRPRKGVFVLKRPDESLLSVGALKKQKDHSKHGACFLSAGLEFRDGQGRGSGPDNHARTEPGDRRRIPPTSHGTLSNIFAIKVVCLCKLLFICNSANFTSSCHCNTTRKIP